MKKINFKQKKIEFWPPYVWGAIPNRAQLTASFARFGFRIPQVSPRWQP